MINLKFSSPNLSQFVEEQEVVKHYAQLENAYATVVNQSGRGNDFLGWLSLPKEFDANISLRIRNCADRLAAQSEIVVVIGIGGSYLGARAVIEALQNPFKAFGPKSDNGRPTVLFAGNSLSEDYLHDLLEILDARDYSLVVISKSGTTTEPAIAFRILKEHCEKKYGVANAKERIVAITDAARGALKKLADDKGYDTFVIPDNVGGRYSVLTPVGLLPIAIAGFDIDKIMGGAIEMREYLYQNGKFENNVAMQYALLRYLLYSQKNKKVELLVAYEPRLNFFIEWYKQLFGESEGKEHKAIFPAGAIFSTDLHSLGQYIQEGERHLMETVISVANAESRVQIPFDVDDIDGLNYLQTKTLHEVNLTAQEGTLMAHLDGGVPNFKISIPEINEASLGEMIYFFEFACALGGYLLDINPFDQPGVEAYKKNMFKLLGKPSK
ncbi:MAG: glucose-6-phosphate isomerase [Bacteroidales bacterium]|nr:glucose-6-phosphate isomerase [Bacteroidales bacterium]